MCRTDDLHGRSDQVLHRLFGFHPRATAARPAGAGVQRDFQAQTLCLFNRVFEQTAPLIAHERNGPAGNPHVDFHNDHAADARRLQRLEVGRNPFTTEVAVHDEPIDPRSSRGRGLLKPRCQIILSERFRMAQQRRNCHKAQSHSSNHGSHSLIAPSPACGLLIYCRSGCA